MWNVHVRTLANGTYVRSLRQAQISILEIFNIFLCLKFSLSLKSNINYHISKVSCNQQVGAIKMEIVLWHLSYQNY